MKINLAFSLLSLAMWPKPVIRGARTRGIHHVHVFKWRMCERHQFTLLAQPVCLPDASSPYVLLHPRSCTHSMSLSHPWAVRDSIQILLSIHGRPQEIFAYAAQRPVTALSACLQKANSYTRDSKHTGGKQSRHLRTWRSEQHVYLESSSSDVGFEHANLDFS